MDDMRTRLATWWTTLDPDLQERLLALDEDDTLPPDAVAGLVHAGISPVSQGFWPEQGQEPVAFHQPQELRAFLAELADGSGV